MKNSTDDELIYKILVVGDIGTGKTSIIKKYVHGTFQSGYKCTIGVDFAMKTIEREDYTVKLLLWDIAGQERFSSMTRIYYREASAAVIVYDISRSSTHSSVTNWLEDLRLKLGPDIPVFIFSNKCDVCPKMLDDELPLGPITLDEYCAKNNIIKYFKTSALSGININEGMETITEYLLSKETRLQTVKKTNINITKSREKISDDKRCCQ